LQKKSGKTNNVLLPQDNIQGIQRIKAYKMNKKILTLKKDDKQNEISISKRGISQGLEKNTIKD